MKKIAVIEDNPDNQLLMQVILQDRYEVFSYEDGLSALTGLTGSVPDIVLLDISLPEMDGVEVLRRIRQDPKLHHLPVLAITAHAMSGDREKYLSVGFDGYVSKPITDENLLFEAIEQGLAGR